MARIRSVKPELRRDLTVAEWTRECRYAWVLLWGYLDDYGRGLDDLRLLVADLFPLDRDVTERKLNTWLERMAAPTINGSAPLCRYEVGGRRFLHAPKWSRSQKVSHPQDSKIPPCPVHDRDQSQTGTQPDTLPMDSGTDPEPFATSRTPEDLGVKGSRGQGVKGPSGAALPPGAQVLVTEWVSRCPARPPSDVVGHVGRVVAKLLDDQVQPEDIQRGLASWAEKGLHPSSLPSEVNAVMNARPGTGLVPVGGRPPRRSASDEAAQQAIDAGARVAARRRAQESA